MALLGIDYDAGVHQCVTGRGGERRPRDKPHEGRHLDGCRIVYPCGCEQRYYTAFYYKGHGFRFYPPDKTLMTTLSDGYCEPHFRARMAATVQPAKGQQGAKS